MVLFYKILMINNNNSLLRLHSNRLKLQYTPNDYRRMAAFRPRHTLRKESFSSNAPEFNQRLLK